MAQRLKRLPAMRETRVQSLGWEDPLEREWLPSPVFLPGEPQGQRSLAGYRLWGCKVPDVTEQLTHKGREKMAKKEVWKVDRHGQGIRGRRGGV